MAVTFTAAAEDVRKARTAEELFGVDAGLARAAYRILALALHPDRNGGTDEANVAFARLQRFWTSARKRIDDGSYGRSYGSIEGKSGAGYDIGSPIGHGDISDVHLLYGATDVYAGKIVRRPARNDLVAREFRTIKTIRRDAQVAAYFPAPHELVAVNEKGGIRRNVAIYQVPTTWPTLADVQREYPDGIDPRDMAWIWRRLLTALGDVHDAGYVHGAVFPEHVLIHPTAHGLVLLGFTASAPIGETISVVSKRHVYPREIMVRLPVDEATDTFMAATMMARLLGRDAPPAIRAHLRSMLASKQTNRSSDVYAIRVSFDEIIHKLWGRRRYHALPWPRDLSRTT